MPTTPSRQVAVQYDGWQAGPQYFKNRRAGIGGKGYTCDGMQVYRDGSIGPAPGVREWPDTGWSGSWDVDDWAQTIWHPRADDYKGQVWVLGADGTGNKITFYTFDGTPTWAASAALEAIDPAWASWYDQGPEEWSAQQSQLDPAWTPRQGGGVQHVMSLNDRIFGAELRLNAAGAASAFGWTEGDPMINWTEYRGRIYAWRGANGDHPTRVWYSDIDDYQAQTSALQYFDVGISNNSVYIKGAWALRDSILFCLSNDDWYAYSGVPGASQLRFVGRYVGPAHQAAGVVLGNELYFVSPITLSPCVATPQGVDSTTLDHVEFSGFQSRFPGRMVASTPHNALYQSFNIAEIPLTSSSFGWNYLEFVNGVWVPGSLQDADGVSLVDTVTIAHGDAYAFLGKATPSQSAVLRTRDVVLDRPSSSDDLWSDTQSASGSISLAPFSPEPGNEARARNVIIEGRYWKGSSYATPSIGVTGMTQGGTALGSLADASGEFVRLVFRDDADAPFSGHTQVELTGIVGFAIDRVVVEYEVRPINHWLGQETGS